MREGRHDVVFLERNGLRRGEFGFGAGVGLGLGFRRAVMNGVGVEDGGGMKWGYKVLEITWSSDSNVLALWIRGESGDFGEFSLLSYICVFFLMFDDWEKSNYGQQEIGIGTSNKKYQLPLKQQQENPSPNMDRSSREDSHLSAGTPKWLYVLYSPHQVRILHHINPPF